MARSRRDLYIPPWSGAKLPDPTANSRGGFLSQNLWITSTRAWRALKSMNQWYLADKFMRISIGFQKIW